MMPYHAIRNAVIESIEAAIPGAVVTESNAVLGEQGVYARFIVQNDSGITVAELELRGPLSMLGPAGTPDA